jgi:hypothetical protein
MLDNAVSHHTRFQKRIDVAQQTLVPDAFAQSLHQSVVVDFVEEFLQIYVNHPFQTPLDVRRGRFYGFVCPSTGAESVTVLTEMGVVVRVQYLMYRLLE